MAHGSSGAIALPRRPSHFTVPPRASDHTVRASLTSHSGTSRLYVPCVRRSLIALCCVGCGFAPGSAGNNNGDPDGGATGADAPNGFGSGSGTPFVALHVPAGGQSAGTADLALTASTTIDTDALTIGAPLPSGVTFDHWAQASGPELAVLHVRGLSIGSSALVTVIGVRSLVVLASEVIDVEGRIDGGAKATRAGAAGSQAQAGAGAGGVGLNTQTYYDSGGGGASYGTAGNSGGNSTNSNNNPNLAGGAGGATQGTDLIASLVGGSGGGNADRLVCDTQTGGNGGAGGGAIQLSTPSTISINGAVLTGGGGGAGGTNCVGDGENWGAGGGGGAGGAIVLQGSSVTVGGLVAANGGAGGGGAGAGNGDANGPGVHGYAGDDGGSALAHGGGLQGGYSAEGGDGATGSTVAKAGTANTQGQGNGGGGGGGVGRILLKTEHATTPGTVSPAPKVTP